MNDDTIERDKNKQTVISAPVLDYDAYRVDWADLELTAEQEHELLSILWEIMSTMCDLSLEMDAVQMIMPSILCRALDDKTAGKPGETEKVNQRTDTQNNRKDKSDG
ncbi:MAG: hypothetical protein NMNS01_21330 [Nitrosomonas sp.]|nr:MAG: hypothetical protein NMNS01_21330 [Nitrosomonas sp.]